MFVSPPTNHLACGSVHSRTFPHFLNQWKLFATFVQNREGLLTDSSYISRYWAMDVMWACFEKSRLGLNTRFFLQQGVELFVVDHENTSRLGQVKSYQWRFSAIVGYSGGFLK